MALWIIVIDVFINFKAIRKEAFLFQIDIETKN